MHNEVTRTCKRGGEGPLEVMECQETNGFNVSSIRPPVAELCQVASCMKMSFKDNWSILVREQKIKQSDKSACRRLLQVCMGNADMGRPPKLARSMVLQS